MKISELVQQLNSIQARYGDINVMRINSEDNKRIPIGVLMPEHPALPNGGSDFSKPVDHVVIIKVLPQ